MAPLLRREAVEAHEARFFFTIESTLVDCLIEVRGGTRLREDADAVTPGIAGFAANQPAHAGVVSIKN